MLLIGKEHPKTKRLVASTSDDTVTRRQAISWHAQMPQRIYPDRTGDNYLNRRSADGNNNRACGGFHRPHRSAWRTNRSRIDVLTRETHRNSSRDADNP